ncbi:hypothetical protein QK290_01615 [Pseudarthrobacter sp. AL07]|nr:hypothetical protein [Pseudarthrobacter sp. AL07]MDI3192938.1 hypothetical protein [Pseudarthrobacter sp. AL20]MDI3207243.1 hypothetical protein [Pseudarthrobacter sp. AL07]
MDFVFWIILIVPIVGVVWWLLNRSNSSSTGESTPIRTDGGLAGGSAAASAEAAGTTGIPSAAGFGTAEPAPPTTADDAPEHDSTAEPQDAAAVHQTGLEEVDVEKDPSDGQDAGHEPIAAGSTDAEAEDPVRPEDVSTQQPRIQEAGSQESVSRQADEAEWETQWSEASVPTQPAASRRPSGDSATVMAAIPLSELPAAQGTGPEHHPEYTEPHAPTLPGAETAAAEAVETESAAVAPAAVADSDAAPEPTGHLAADQPYGAGSASPGPDGSGPADFDVKANAGTMVYYEEGHPDYEQTTADVWFESAAHAEAAGFRAPRRTRI